MSTSASIQVRIDKSIKEQASQILEMKYGLSIADAVRILLAKVAHTQKVPFFFDVHNATTRAAMLEADRILASKKTILG